MFPIVNFLECQYINVIYTIYTNKYIPDDITLYHIC